MTARAVLHQTGEVLKAVVLLPPLAVVTALLIGGIFVAKLCGVDFERESME